MEPLHRTNCAQVRSAARWLWFIYLFITLVALASCGKDPVADPVIAESSAPTIETKGTDSSSARAEVEVETPVARVLLLGIDGLEWSVLGPMLDSGRMPNFARFIARGAAGQLHTMLPTYSPILWATIATGRTASEHGIEGFAAKSPTVPGKIVPFTSNVRRTKALWNILSDAGKRTAVIGWWTTWPAEPVSGVMVSDRMLYNRFNLALGYEAFGDDLIGQTWPEELYAELSPLARIKPATEHEMFERFAPRHADRMLERNLHDPYYELFLVYARDAAYLSILENVRAREAYDFLAFYLNGVDIASHYFYKYRFPEQWKEPVDPALLRANGKVIDNYLAYVDEALARLLAQADENTVVIVVSDHGFVVGERPDTPNVSGIHYNKAPPGVIAMAGGSIQPGVTIRGASILDVTPTVLHLLGEPVASDMSGTVLPDAVGGPANLAARPITRLPSYETTPSDRAAPLVTDYDDAIMGRLRALGYLDDPSAVAEVPEEPATGGSQP